ncbi:MAG: hypothetical protein KBA61_19340 [Spirochaetes bacterium]|nr:hypothetical protein [Spirochaetota bacterium]
MSVPDRSVEMIETIALGLDDLLDSVVFIGGAAAACYIDNPAAGGIRPTDDVDCVVSIATMTEYYSFEEKLRVRGFSNLAEPGAPLCRWKYRDVKVDIMPSDPGILGFSNIWYRTGIDTSVTASLPSGRTIRIFTLPLFVASKLEAYKSRAGNDPRFSHDIEDIILVLDGQLDMSRLLDAPGDVLDYLRLEFRALLADVRFFESAIGCIGHGATGPERAKALGEFLMNFSIG